MHKKIYFLASLAIAMSLILAACQTEPEEIITTVIVEKEPQTIIETVVVTVEASQPIPEEPCCEIYRIGLLEEPVSVNYWHYLGLGSVWTQYVVIDDAGHLFELSDQRFQLVPSLAKDLPEPVDNGDGTWSITVEMVSDALWSDGEPITAQDVVFTHNVCVDLSLTLVWPFYCTPHGTNVAAEALDEFTVKYTYLNQAPSVNTWHAGVALAPILPQHFWEGVVAEAYQIVESVIFPEVERPENCNQDTVLASDQEACQQWSTYDQAYETARNKLYDSDASNSPVAGGYRTLEWVPGEYIERVENQNYYFKDAEIIEFQDGTWKRIMPNGTESQFYGNAEGEETLHFRRGPHNPGVVFTFYDSQEAAIDALINGDIDYLPNPTPLTSQMYEKVNREAGIRTYPNTDYDMFYLAFNLLRYPMSEYSFRQAFDILIDKDLLSDQVFGGKIQPLYSTMPEENYFWSSDIGPTGSELTRAERISTAVQILKNAGWSWDVEPSWDEFRQDTVPGVGLRMPDGKYMPEMTIIGPGYVYDARRANFNLLISEWARDMGMPIKTNLTGRSAILDTVFLEADFDMYIFGWSLGDPAFPDYYDTFWHSRNCTVDTGGRNAPCFKNQEYDALVDEFMKTVDPVRAQELQLQMAILLADQRPYIPLYSEKVYDIASDRVNFPYTDLLGGIEFRAGFQIDTQVFKE